MSNQFADVSIEVESSSSSSSPHTSLLANSSKLSTVVSPNAVLKSNNLPEPVYDDDHPAPFSWNPRDWATTLKDEVMSREGALSFAMTEKKRILYRAMFGEFLVTFLFLFIVQAVQINNGRQGISYKFRI